MASLTKTRSQSRKHVSRSLAAVVMAISLVAVSTVPSEAGAAKPKAAKSAAKDPREMQAREAFAAGSYKEALEIYTKLYAEKLHPTYLRNIGRCYQNLNEPDRAISSFREYLRKAKDMPADERAEVEGYIKEMEDQQKKTAVAEPVATPAQPLPLAAPPVQAQPSNPAVAVVEPVREPAPAETPFYKKGWFWGVVGVAVVAGTVGGLWAGGVFSSSQSCPSGAVCR
jgi:hypothetical protein